MSAEGAVADEHRGLRCDGCAHNHYSAMYGLVLGNKPPHSRCLALARDIPIVVNARKEWIRSEIPADCPEAASHKRKYV